jgi:hypothetical protein
MSEHINKAFLWPKARDFKNGQTASHLYKHDALLVSLEQLVTDKRAWGPIKGTTKRTESEQKLRDWLQRQNLKCLSLQQLPDFHHDYGVELSLSDFPENTRTANTRVVTTSPNIAYLLDDTGDFTQSLSQAFGAKSGQISARVLSEEIGTFVYVTNSVESGGRAFSGDPFTGQVAAYSRIFAHDLLGNRVLNFVAYYPHQLYSQFYTARGLIPNNKGVKMLRSQATLIVSCGGILLEPREWKIISEPSSAI